MAKRVRSDKGRGPEKWVAHKSESEADRVTAGSLAADAAVSTIEQWADGVRLGDVHNGVQIACGLFWFDDQRQRLHDDLQRRRIAKGRAIDLVLAMLERERRHNRPSQNPADARDAHEPFIQDILGPTARKHWLSAVEDARWTIHALRSALAATEEHSASELQEFSASRKLPFGRLCLRLGAAYAEATGTAQDKIAYSGATGAKQTATRFALAAISEITETAIGGDDIVRAVQAAGYPTIRTLPIPLFSSVF